METGWSFKQMGLEKNLKEPQYLLYNCTQKLIQNGLQA